MDTDKACALTTKCPKPNLISSPSTPCCSAHGMALREQGTAEGWPGMFEVAGSGASPREGPEGGGAITAPREPQTHKVGSVHDAILDGVRAVQRELQNLLLFLATFRRRLLLLQGERERG